MNSNRVLVFIIVAQFCGTSLWFAGNAALPQLIAQYSWEPGSLGYLTTAVQVGFIIGTLLFALLGITDRFSPSNVFFICCLLGAGANLAALAQLESFSLVLGSRLTVGFFLAGIYPVGMKIAADWQEKGLGHWLGLLVGALVLGTAFPHLLRAFPLVQDVRLLLGIVSLLAVLGGCMILWGVADGPFRKTGTAFSFQSVVATFRLPVFRKPALGYFGHMWELYTFWAFVPFIISQHSSQSAGNVVSPSLLAYFVIGIGAIGCGWGGFISKRTGSEKVALYTLVASGVCCLLSPLMLNAPLFVFIFYLLLWGATVVADSPQFSSLVSLSAPPEMRGSAITMVTCIGFSLTVVSIQLLNILTQAIDSQYVFLFLAPGPVLGVLALKTK